MFNKNKWDIWYENLPDSTREWLKKQPVWHDRDLALLGSVCIAFGFFIGWIFK